MIIRVRDFYSIRDLIKVKSYKPFRFKNKYALRIKLENAIDITLNNKVKIINEVIVINRYWFSNKLKRLKTFPIIVNVYDIDGSPLFYAELIEDNAENEEL